MENEIKIGEWYKSKKVILVIIITILTILLAATRGIHFGIEFAGGTRIPITLEESVSKETMEEIVEAIKIRTSKFGLAGGVVKSIGDQQIYVEVTESDPELLSEVEKILQTEGKFEAIIDGGIGLEGGEIVKGSIRENPEKIGDDIKWGVAFVITQKGGKKFADVAYRKANYPVNLFLDREKNSIIVLNYQDLYIEDELFTITDEEKIKAISEILNISNNHLVLIEEGDDEGKILKKLKNLINEMNKTNQTLTKIIVSESNSYLIPQEIENVTESEIIMNQTKMNRTSMNQTIMNLTIVKKEDEDMKMKFVRDEITGVRVSEWGGIGLLSSPSLSENLATGKVSQMFEITGRTVGATYQEKQENAILEMKKIKSILSGGALPVRMTLGSTTTVPAALGKEFLNFSIIGIIVAYVVILGIVLIRYRKPVFIPPLIFIPLCQITTLIALLGGIGTLDLSTIAGLFGSIGTSVDAQIVVTDSLISKKIENREEAKRRVKKGFYVITRDAFIVIIAIIPLLFANIVEIIGFATAMLIGMVLSVFITTQTYGAIVESMFEDKIK